MDSETIIGIGGAVLILFAFTLNQFQVWKTNYILYDTVNLLGGSILVLYSFLIGSIPFLILNVVWTLVALRDVMKFVFHKR